ncbi:MAG: histidine kinase [Geobacteraceae bacterium GWC2_58_44]|nr:MAG: histidine kinase [Geobacteraceae bacterium GWC2_58_44]
MEKRLSFGIKTKFIVVSSLIMALSSVTWGGWFWYKESGHILQRMESEGRLLLTSIEAPIIDAILYEKIGVVEENVGLLDNFIEQLAARREPRVIYAFITDGTGRAIAHSNLDMFGRTYRDPLTLSALSGHDFTGRKARQAGMDAPVFDMAMPLRIAGKSWGALRVGISMAASQAEQERLKREILLFSGLFFLVGNAIFYVVGLTMSRPLKELSAAMVGVNYRSLDVPAPPRRRTDEIGQLQDSFNEMLGRLKKTEQERQRAVAQLIQNERMATIGKIVAGVAHEINNPLMVMSTSLFHLERKVPQELGRYVETHKEGMQRIETIVRQLSDFSRAGTLDLQRVPSSVFFKETAGFAGMALKRHDVRLVSRDLAPETMLAIDKGKLHQVVLNLLLNASDASPAGAAVELTACLEGTNYCLAVRDGGEGIAPEHRGRIFEIFFTTKPGGEGSGIGLAISKSIVEMHRGEISFESRPGETTFLVRIPLPEGTEHG